MLKVPNLPPAIAVFVSRLAARGHAVWLIGSQVNPSGKPPADWDLLIFGDSALLEDLSQAEPVPGCDPMVVYDGEYFRKPWSPGGDSGSLTKWEWKIIADRAATYQGTKWPDNWGEERVAIRID